MRNNAWFFAFLLALATVGLAAWAGYEAGAAGDGGSVARRGVWSPGPVTHSLAPPMQVPTLPPSQMPVDSTPPQGPEPFTIDTHGSTSLRSDIDPFAASCDLSLNNAQGANIVDIRVQGNEEVSLARIAQRIQSRKGSPLDQATVATDVANLYEMRRFDSITTKCIPVEGGVVLDFRLSEGLYVDPARFSFSLPLIAGPPTLIDPNVSLLPAADELWSELPEADPFASSFETASANVPVAFWQGHATEPSDEQSTCPAEGEPSTADDQPSESAATILEMRKRLGSVLQDTVFAPEGEADAEAERRAILQHLREFEEQNAAPPEASPEGSYTVPPAAPPHELTHRASCPHAGDQDAAARVIGSLREVSAQIDQLANELERANMFCQADNLRGMAQQLREDARAATRGRCPCQHVRERNPQQETITELPEVGERVPSY